jgi:hypothetical protein
MAVDYRNSTARQVADSGEAAFIGAKALLDAKAYALW